jgi:Uma2 family endonuclease
MPDIVFVHRDNLDIVIARRIIGTPDLVIEIAAPETVSFDRREKQDAYAHSGIPEYWRVDPGNRTVEVLVLREGAYYPYALVAEKQQIPSMQLPGLQFATDDIFLSRDLEQRFAQG